MQSKHNKQLVPLAKQLRKEMTKEERHLWYDYLRSYHVRFLRQKTIGKYIVDLHCAEAKLIVELDGSQHYETKHHIEDLQRDAYLKDAGFTVLRYSNADINVRFRSVCEDLDRMIRERSM